MRGDVCQRIRQQTGARAWLGFATQPGEGEIGSGTRPRGNTALLRHESLTRAACNQPILSWILPSYMDPSINPIDMAESSNSILRPHSSGKMSEKQKGKQRATISSVSQVQLDESRLDHVSSTNLLAAESELPDHWDIGDCTARFGIPTFQTQCPICFGIRRGGPWDRQGEGS